MLIHRLYQSIPGRARRIVVVPRQLCNTVAYCLCGKKSVIVVNAAIFQFLWKVRHHNIGDDLNYYLIKALSGKKVFANRSFYHFNRPVHSIMAIGSVIDWMGNSDSIVWGAGIISPPDDMNKPPRYQFDRVCAVRGKRTRELLLKSGVACPEVYGDPALLMPYIYRPKIDKVKGRIGFIPHYSDVKNPNLVRLMLEYGDGAILIRVQDYKNWKDVIDKILSCEYVVSSSLHGLILSDAYGVSNQWITFREASRRNRFKYEDYYSSVDKDAVAVMITDSTKMNELLERKEYYKNISFDPRPLLRACPFEIVHPVVLEVLNSNG